MEINDILGFGKPLVKLIETVQNAVGWIFNPIKKRRSAKADATVLRLICQEMRENIDIPIKYDKEGISIDTTDLQEIIERSRQRNLYQEYIKETNIEAVVKNAAELLGKKDVVSDNPVDSTWANLFFDSAGYISDPELQKLWGDLLAAEVEKPGRSSMRTLEIVKTLSVEEVRIFDRVVEYIMYTEDEKHGVFDYFIFSGEPLLDKTGITFPELMMLKGAGLLAFFGDRVVVGSDIKPGCIKHICAGDEVVIEIYNNSNQDKGIDIPTLFLTEAGYEIYDIVYKQHIRKEGKESYYMSCKNTLLKRMHLDAQINNGNVNEYP